jgi:hypothetical protein
VRGRVRLTNRDRWFFVHLYRWCPSALQGEAGEVMAVVQSAMLTGMPYTGLRDAIIAHPTMAEGLVALFSNVPTS